MISPTTYQTYKNLPPLAGVATHAEAATPGLGIEECVRRLKRFHYAFKRLFEILTARITAEPIYELKTAFAHHAYLCAEHVDALRVLGNVVEPAKGYARVSGHKYNTGSPLNGLPDSVPPESLGARKFSLLVDKVVAGNASPDDIASVRELMGVWKSNHDRLSQALQNSLLTEDAVVSQNLATAGNIGLQALDMFGTHASAPAGWSDQQMAQLEQMKKPQAELLLMVVPAVEKLVQAVGRP
jgi:hypothetical protein